MDFIHIDVTGARNAGLRFEEFPSELHDELMQEIDALTIELYALVQAATPTRTGKLHSQERTKLFDDGNKIKGSVFIAGKGSGSNSDFAKAGALEYGSTGEDFRVAAHPMQLDHFLNEKFDAPITVMVKAHDRASSIAEHAFLRGPLAAMTPEVLARLNAVVDKAVAKVNA